MTGTLFCFGMGYSAQELATLCLPRGWQVAGTTRDPVKAARMSDQGIRPLLLPDAEIGAKVRAASHILISAAPGENGDPALPLIRAALGDGGQGVKWLGYLSTTGVYGDHGGGWVDESTPLTPTTRRGRWRVSAEAEWQDYAQTAGLPLHIFRLAGIYGPGRGPFEKVRTGRARRIIKQGQVFSRIHVADIARILLASMRAPQPGAVYNLCDDDPAPPQDVLSHAADLLGLPPPPEVAWKDAEMSAMARSFYAESKRVSNERMKRELGIELLYPDYRSGLRAVLDAQTG